MQQPSGRENARLYEQQPSAFTNNSLLGSTPACRQQRTADSLLEEGAHQRADSSGQRSGNNVQQVLLQDLGVGAYSGLSTPNQKL